MLVGAAAQPKWDSIPSLKSPYHTLLTHLDFLQEGNYDPAKSALAIPPAYRNGQEEEMAIRLKRILDGRGLYVLMSEVPAVPDYRDTLTKRNVYTLFPNKLPSVYLQKVGDSWYYSGETLEQLDQLYRETFPYGVDQLVDMFPPTEGRHYLGLTRWQWLGLVLLLGLAFVLYWLGRILLRPIVALIRRIVVERFPLTEDEMKRLVHLLGLIVSLRFIQIFLPALQLPVRIAEFIIVGSRVGQTIFIVWLVLKLLDITHRYLSEVVAKTESKVDDHLLPILTRSLRVLILIGGFIQVLRLFEVNVTAIIAGVSLGGLALALAAQDTVKNFIGSIMIILDRPFQVGDFISTGGLEGTVVEVGFRTSRIQMVDTSIISIPNGQLADSRVTNLGVRPKRIINIKIGVQYNTPPDRIEAFIEGLKKIINDHPQLSHEPVYVHLNDFAASSIDILFRCYIEVLTFAEELQVREQVLFSVLRLAKELGVSFAFPSTSLYVESLPERPVT